MFTALVTFLVTVTMILGGAGAPVDVILDSLSIDLATTLNVEPIEEDPEELEAPKGNQYQIGQDDGFDPPPKRDAGIDPTPKDCEDDGSCPSPVHIRTRDRLKDAFSYRYRGDKPDDTEDPIDVEEPLAVEPVEEDPVEQVDKGQQGPEAGTGKEEGFVPPEPNPTPDPTPDPVPDPERKEKDCVTYDCPEPAPDPQPEPEPVPVEDHPTGPEPAPAPAPAPNDCETDNSCPEPAYDPDPKPDQPATGGGDGNDSETDGSDNGSSYGGENGK